MSVVRFPTGLLSHSQMGLARAQLSGMLLDLSDELMEMQLEVSNSSNAPEFAAAVWAVAGKLAEASNGWQAIANTMRESWRV
jgi:hypothetical protein